MFVLRNLNQLEKAVEKAQKVKPVVRMIDFGVYAVKGSKDSYEVRMERKNGQKLIMCNCIAGERGFVCYHSVSALELHSTIAAHKTAIAQ